VESQFYGTISGVTREGVGTGLADSETGIKKAEHDALKRAAVKFGVVRDCYWDDLCAALGTITWNSRNFDERCAAALNRAPL